MTPLTFLTAIALLPAPAMMIAQDIAPLATGQRVRVTAPTISNVPIVGALAHLNADTFLVETHGDTSRVPRAAVERLDVSMGQKSNAGKGALFGGLLGGGIGALALGSSSLCADLEASGTCALVGAGGGGLAGLLLGALIGSTSKRDRWESASVDRLRVSFIPREHGRLLLAASVSF